MIWVAASIPAGIEAALGMSEEVNINPFMAIGFVLMIGGPAVYIVIIPIVNYLKRRRLKRARAREL